MRIVVLFLMMLPVMVNAQTSRDEIDILNEFVTTTQDSVFITKYSKQPYEKFVAEQLTLPHTFDVADSLIFYHHNKGDILGPYFNDSFQIYVKVIAVDSLLRMRVGNIYLDEKKHGKKFCDKLAGEILKTVKETGDYDAMCKKYSDDENGHYNCDLGWFFQGAMVKEFEEEVLKHKKDDCFVVTTQFGKHVVKMIANPVLDRSRVEYVFLYLDK